MIRNSISYSIWLLPPPELFDSLQIMIKRLCKKYNSPLFIPHITLISGFLGDPKEILKKFKKTQLPMSEISVEFDSIITTNEFFKSVFFQITLSDSFIKARTFLNPIFTCNEKCYQPHLSMIYGRFTKIEKKNIINEIGSVPINFKVNEFFLAYNNEIDLYWNLIWSKKINE